MLENDDLPDGWEVVASPIPEGNELERLLQRTYPSSGDPVHSWDEIQSTTSGTRIILRMAPPEVIEGRIVNDGARVTGVVILPPNADERVTAADMRFPLGSIESAANMRRADLAPGVRAMIMASDYTPPAPVGRPDGTDEFYARVAELWRFFVDDDNPTERVREVNEVSLPTAQRWVTEARKRKMLPPGRRGRAK